MKGGGPPSGAGALSVGSLPHSDPAAAVALVLGVTPGLPALPQLPGRGESMLAQLVPWLDGVQARPSGHLGLIGNVPVAPRAWEGGLPLPGWSALPELLDQAGAGPVKVQLAGPVTLAWALHRAGVARAAAMEVAAGAVSQALTTLADVLPGPFSITCVLDEPALAPVAVDEPPAACRLLSEAVATCAHLGLRPGLHCCGPAGTAAPLAAAVGAGASLLSLPLRLLGPAEATVLAHHVRHGGEIAWGVIPADGSPPPPAAVAAADLERWWARHPGPDWRARALMSPECGLGLRQVDEAEALLRLAAAVAECIQLGVAA